MEKFIYDWGYIIADCNHADCYDPYGYFLGGIALEKGDYKKLEDGADPIVEGWEDGAGNTCNIDGWED
jgi:hypothetical protein